MIQPPGPPCILIADDDAPLRQALSIKLRSAGYAVRTARDGGEALREASRDGIDLIVTDFQMPHLSGLEVCQMLRGQERVTPAILLTGHGYAITPDALALAGVARVIAKPFSPRDLVAVVADVLAEAARRAA